jgi:histidine triad (HIT) family protein
MMADRCVFCRIIRGELPAHRVYEDERVLAFLDINPSAPGHTLILPKAHVAQVEDLSEEDASALFRALHLLVGRIQEAVGATASTIGINNGLGSGQEIPHVHIHIIPRSKGDRGRIIQGIVRSTARHDEDDMIRIAGKIKEQVTDEVE